MRTRERVTVAVIAILLAGALAACSGPGNPRFGGADDGLQPGYEEHVDDRQYEQEEPTQAEIDQFIQEADQSVRDQLGLNAWSCTLSVTFNDDWHDDVLCSNGTESHRPYLREGDDFIEEWEIMESAAEYEAQLNSGP